MSATSPENRSKLVEALNLDLVGPCPGHAFANELLPENPTRWYLTGYLVPEIAPVQRLRTLHAAMDTAVLTVHGWNDLLPKCTCEFLLDYEDDDSESAAESDSLRRGASN